MSRWSKRSAWGIWLALVSMASPAADLKTVQLAPIAPKVPTIQVAPSVVVAVPTISGLQPTGACVNKGATVIVQGKNFGTASGRSVALGGQGIHVDLAVSSWSTTSIAATIPNDPKIAGGKWYYIGIEKSDHSQWLSNIDRTITICESAAAMLSPLQLAPLAVAPSGPGKPPTGAASGGADDKPPQVGSAPPTGGGFGAAPAATVPPIGGGSTLNAPLPRPPQDAPPAPVKESTAIEPAELVVVSSNMAEAQQLAAQAQALRLSIKRRSNLGGLGFVVTVFRVPKELGVGNALLALRQAQPNAWADANHRFQLMGDEAKTYGKQLIGWNNADNCGAGIRIGLVDTVLDASHPMLQGRQIQQRDFLSTGTATSGAEHGTAIAALLVGKNFGLVPGAQLFAANVFRVREKETDTTAESVVLALNWLAENRVAVINLSLGGPRNLLVEAAVQRLTEIGVAIVAAAGNGGADAPPVFPAAQPGVVAVTAIDANLNPFPRANRGDYVAFAAPGVDVWTAAPGRDGVFVSGTSYATPFATAALASLRLTSKNAWPALIKQLQARARDLGASGKDPVFGWGLLQVGGCAARRL
jgi:hypothetical protein